MLTSTKKMKIGFFPKLTDLLRSVWIREGEGLRQRVERFNIIERGESKFIWSLRNDIAREVRCKNCRHARDLSLLVRKKPRCYDSLFMFVGILAEDLSLVAH